ncbi:LOW QUALITY PROTEIN: zf-RING_2 domain-containing protein, partial [Cephalotus follicularis]
HPMDQLEMLTLILYLVYMFFHVEAQSSTDGEDATSVNAGTNFQPSLAVVVGVLCIMFSITFSLIIFTKFCRSRGSTIHGDPHNHHIFIRSTSRFSGIDKTVIESLPFFRFSSLRGSKEGLQCAVCLSKYEDIEVLRLLPKCKHAFHINCVDQWLERHSSCPLRQRVNAEDPTIFAYSSSMRFLWDQSEPRQDSNVELFVQREEDHRGSSRFSIGSDSFRIVEKGGDKEEEMFIQDEEAGDDDQQVLHKFNHKVIVSDVVYKNRWSNVSSSDLMFLNSEMLGAISSNRFSSLEADGAVSIAIEDEQFLKIKAEMDKKRMIEIEPAQRRVVSEITAVSRFGGLNMKNKITGSASSLETNAKEERMRQLWLPIARRTVQWFTNRER